MVFFCFVSAHYNKSGENRVDYRRENTYYRTYVLQHNKQFSAPFFPHKTERVFYGFHRRLDVLHFFEFHIVLLKNIVTPQILHISRGYSIIFCHICQVKFNNFVIFLNFSSSFVLKHHLAAVFGGGEACYTLEFRAEI